MKYITKTDIETLRDRYDYIIGWGISDFQMERFYNPSMYSMDYLVNGVDKEIGSIVCGNKVYDVSLFDSLDKNKRFLFIIFTNMEDIITNQITKTLGHDNYDYIVNRLICSGDHPKGFYYSASGEDLIIKDILCKLNISHPKYIDIGVCHPVVSNNTFMFHELGGNGVLVEPNPYMAKIASEYRPNDIVCNVGVTSTGNSELQYVMHRTHPGINHILREGEDLSSGDLSIHSVNVININELLSEQRCEDFDILDIDIEGMDYEVLEAIDFSRFRIKIICHELWGSHDYRKLLMSRGYTPWMRTMENSIYVKNEEAAKILK